MKVATEPGGPARSKAQWKKSKPKSRCECHSCGEREGEGQNSSYLHGNHPSSAMFGAFRGWLRPHAKQTIAIAVKYPMKSAAIVISASILPAVFRRWCSDRRKTVPYVTAEIEGDIELFLAPPGSGQPSRSSRLAKIEALGSRCKRPRERRATDSSNELPSWGVN